MGYRRPSPASLGWRWRTEEDGHKLTNGTEVKAMKHPQRRYYTDGLLKLLEMNWMTWGSSNYQTGNGSTYDGRRMNDSNSKQSRIRRPKMSGETLEVLKWAAESNEKEKSRS